MNNISLLLVAVSLALSGRAAAAGHDHAGHGAAKAAESKMETVRGEVVDMNCYMTHGGSGAKHAKCAKQCALSGSPLGVLAADGDLYLLVEDHSKKKAFAALKELAAENVKVSGEVHKRGGVRALVVDSVEKAEKQP